MKNIDIIAFYLPQYHPTKENDEWYGKGFTEWTNVGKSKPLFKGHYQPIVPADLGYYDLRLPEIQEQQAELAKEAGVSAFCYYHYWFGKGRMMLDMPLKQMLKNEKIDLPFCLCWANHTWYNKTWNSKTSVLEQKVLLGIDYGDKEDWKLHFDTLLSAFKDNRYYKIDNRLVFVLYRIQDIPNVEEFKAYWNELAIANGLNGFYFINYIDDPAKLKDPIQNSCEKKIVLLKSNIESIGSGVFTRKLSRFVRTIISQLFKIPMGVYKYSKIRKKLNDSMFADESIIPTILPNWDNTPRRAEGALVLDNANPKEFYLHSKEVFENLKNKENKVVFLKSWNEWGEGNYMEPCLKYGKGYIKALRQSLDEFNK